MAARVMGMEHYSFMQESLYSETHPFLHNTGLKSVYLYVFWEYLDLDLSSN